MFDKKCLLALFVLTAFAVVIWFVPQLSPATSRPSSNNSTPRLLATSPSETKRPVGSGSSSSSSPVIFDPPEPSVVPTGPLRYEFPEDNSPAETARLRQSCSVADLDHVAVFDNISREWYFRPWCDKFLALRSPRDASSNNKLASNSKNNNNNNNRRSKKPSPDSAPFRLDSDQLRALFQNQITLFVGDSVVRNHFVMTMARMCNEKNRGKCMMLMPTFEYDIVRSVPSSRGPLGCIPDSSKNNNSSSSSSSSRAKTIVTPPPPPPLSSSGNLSVDEDLLFTAARAAQQRAAAAGTLTPCYDPSTTSFKFVPANGLTASKEPRRSERKAFLKKGVITPLIRMEVDKSVFYYVPVNTPKQIVRFGKWLAMKAQARGGTVGNEIARAKTVFVSTGPHLSFAEMNSSISMLKPALNFIQSTLQKDSSVILSETTHQLNAPPWHASFVDSVMEQWKAELGITISSVERESSPSPSPATSLDAKKSAAFELVPQRFVTVGGYVLWRPWEQMRVREKGGQEIFRKKQRTCTYYDQQHPGLPCQEILTELMLMTAYAARASKFEQGLVNASSGSNYAATQQQQPDRKPSAKKPQKAEDSE